MEKKLVNPRLRADSTLLYNWCVVHSIMLGLIPYMQAGKTLRIVFDRSLSTTKMKAFNEYTRNKASYLLFEKGESLPSDCIHFSHISSEREPCLQAADAVAGAYFQKYEKQKDEYVDVIKEKVGFLKYLWK